MKHKAFCLITDAEKSQLEAEAKKAGMTVATLLKSRIFPPASKVKQNANGMTMRWECEQVSLIVNNLDYATWKLLSGVVQVAEPDKPKPVVAVKKKN